MTLKRILATTTLTLITLPCAAYLADLALWHLRSQPTSTVNVTRFVVAPLKGGKEEYYPDGTTDLDCSQSLFPQAGAGPCWYLQRHRTVFDR